MTSQTIRGVALAQLDGSTERSKARNDVSIGKRKTREWQAEEAEITEDQVRAGATSRINKAGATSRSIKQEQKGEEPPSSLLSIACTPG